MPIIKRLFESSEGIKFNCYIFIQINEDGKRTFWFNGQDVADFLGYIHSNALTQYVNSEWKETWARLNKGKPSPCFPELESQPKHIFVSERGLCALITNSGHPQAEAFKDWIYIHVLPDLYKLDINEESYDNQQELTEDLIASNKVLNKELNETRQNSEKARQDAVKLSEELNEARQDAENARQDAKNARQDAENARQEVENVTRNAENTRQDAENARQEALNARRETENARRETENARRETENARRETENARRENQELADRVVKMARDVIAKPNCPDLLHCLIIHTFNKKSHEIVFTRCQKRSLNATVNRLRGKNPNSKRLYYIGYVPNGINVLNCAKEWLQQKNIFYRARNNRIRLSNASNRRLLIRHVRSLTRSVKSVLDKYGIVL